MRVFPDSRDVVYIRQKTTLHDAGTADQSMLTGSQNASIASLNYDRELPVRSDAGDGAAVIAFVVHAFHANFDLATARRPPTERVGEPPVTVSATTVRTAGLVAPHAACYPIVRSGNCYRPGQYCPHANDGQTGAAQGGEKIVRDDDGRRRERTAPPRVAAAAQPPRRHAARSSRWRCATTRDVSRWHRAANPCLGQAPHWLWLPYE